MKYTSATSERSAALTCAQAMVAAARTAPKACGIDLVETLIIDGVDKDRLTATMRAIGNRDDKAFYIRDAGNIDDCHCVVLIGSGVKARGLDCHYCGVPTCDAAEAHGIACALSVDDLGIAVGSAASVAMDHRIDNRVLFSAGKAALALKLFPEEVKMCLGIGLATKGKNIFFDRQAV